MSLLPTCHLKGEYGSSWTWGPFRALHLKFGGWTFGSRWRAWLADSWNFHSARHGFSWNEGGSRGAVLVVYWSGALSPFFDVAIRLPRSWVGAGFSGRKFYTRRHTWNAA